jgi:hypothetical protein
MYLKAMVITCKTIMLAAPAKAIARPTQCCANKTRYSVSHASKDIQQNDMRNKLMQVCVHEQSIKISLLQH